MGWTRELASGKYQAQYRNLNGDVRSAGTFTQKKQAQKTADKVEDEQREPGALDLDGSKVQWGDWFDSWHDSRIVAYSTEKDYRSTVKNHIRPHWGNTKLADIEQVNVAKWVKTLHTNGASPYTIRNAHTIFKASLQVAVDGHRLLRNPAKGVRLPDLPDAVERFLTRDEVEAITFYMGGLNALIVWTAVQTGMRFGELSGLHRNRLDLDRGMIDVVEKYDQAADRIDPLPKDREKRTVPLPPELVDKLRRHLDRTSPERTCGLTHTAGRCQGDLVFRGPRGAVLKSAAWGVGPWRTALDLAGVVDRARVHDMRHTYASWLIQDGVSLADIARVMGHSDSEVTRRYARLQGAESDERVRAAIASRPRSHVGDGIAAAVQRQTAAMQHEAPRAAESAANDRHTPLHLVTSEDDENAD